MTRRLANFWTWFARGLKGKPGYRRLLNRWLYLHLAVGVAAATMIAVPLGEITEKALLPVMAIFVGLTFSWAGNAHSLLQSPEILRFAAKSDDGVAGYIFTFQLSILVLLATMTAWLLPSLKLSYPIPNGWGFQAFNSICEVALYGLLSLAMRSSWHAVIGANMLLLAKAELMRGGE